MRSYRYVVIATDRVLHSLSVNSGTLSNLSLQGHFFDTGTKPNGVILRMTLLADRCS